MIFDMVFLTVPHCETLSDAVKYRMHNRAQFLGYQYMQAVIDGRGFRSKILFPYISQEQAEYISLCTNFELTKSLIKSFFLFSLVTQIKQSPSIAYGIGLYFNNIDCSLTLIDQIKKIYPDSIVIVGGHFATFNHENILHRAKNIDVVVKGEGEQVLPTLLEVQKAHKLYYDVPSISYRAGNNVVINPISGARTLLDTLPFPNRTNSGHTGGWYPILTSRGCHANCSFCSIRAFYSAGRGKSLRRRSVDNVLAEIKYLYQRHGAIALHFQDDNFLGTGKYGDNWVKLLFTELRRNRIKVVCTGTSRIDQLDTDVISLLKEGGFRRIEVGIESVSQRALDLYGKGLDVNRILEVLKLLDSAEIEVGIDFIFFDPFLTIEEAIKNFHFLYERRVPLKIYTSKLVVLDGMGIVNKIERVMKGKFNGVYTYRFVDSRIELLYRVFNTVYTKYATLVENLEGALSLSDLHRWQHAEDVGIFASNAYDKCISFMAWVLELLETEAPNRVAMETLSIINKRMIVLTQEIESNAATIREEIFPRLSGTHCTTVAERNKMPNLVL